jgi:Flp pilus assembly protein TadG
MKFVDALNRICNDRGTTRRLSSFVRDEGTVTVEFMLWLPFIFTTILFAVDIALIYLKQADMWNVARDVSRHMSVSSAYNPTSSDVQALLFTSLSSATVTTSGATASNTDKVVTIQIPLCTASLFGIVGCYDRTLNLTASVTMASEY